MIFGCPQKVKYFVTLTSEVEANSLYEISLWVVYRIHLKLLDVCVCVMQVFLMKILWNASWMELISQ